MQHMQYPIYSLIIFLTEKVLCTLYFTSSYKVTISISMLVEPDTIFRLMCYIQVYVLYLDLCAIFKFIYYMLDICAIFKQTWLQDPQIMKVTIYACVLYNLVVSSPLKKLLVLEHQKTFKIFVSNQSLNWFILITESLETMPSIYYIIYFSNLQGVTQHNKFYKIVQYC